MSETQTGHITNPGVMTIVEVGNKLNFYTDVIGISEQLELGKVYNFNADHQYGTMWLSPAEAFKLPARVYDFEQEFRKQILRTLRHPKGNMNIGVLLEGYKGQGKSVIAKQLAIESGLPVIVIGSVIPKMCDFTHYLSQIKQDYVLFVDEFEKLFVDKDHPENKYHVQESFLSFLDGTQGLNHKRLVIFTSNSEIGDKFINRPGRIRYYKKFNFMSKEVFNAVVEDKLEDKSFKQDLIDSVDIPSCTMDIITAIIEEINIQQMPYSTFKAHFNHKERKTVYSKYKRDTNGTWVWVEEISTNKEIGVEEENVKAVFGYYSEVKSNDGDTIIFEARELEADPNDPTGDEIVVKHLYKAVKQKWSKPGDLAF